jgi:hydroxymethylpyrimidine/phosphomethylpyrimidine kinase
MNRTPTVLALSGLDPSGSAGLIADVRVIEGLGCHPCGVVTCQTVQSSKGLIRVEPSEPAIFREQLSILLDDIHPDAVKIGAIASVEIIEIIAEIFAKYKDIPIVLDPVFAPTFGPAFLDLKGVQCLTEKLLPSIYLATPNLHELGVPMGLNLVIPDEAMLGACAGYWLSSGVGNLLVTGLRAGNSISDKLFRQESKGHVIVEECTNTYWDIGEVHGTGCVLSSAIASFIAKGETLSDAVRDASGFTAEVIENAVEIGSGSMFWSCVKS